MTQSSKTMAGVSFVKRPGRNAVSDNAPVEKTVSEVLDAVRTRGDAAVSEYSMKFDQADLAAFEVSDAERQKALDDLDPQSRADTQFAIDNVRAFAEAQLATILRWKLSRCRVCIWDIALFRWNVSAAMCRAGAIRCFRRRS